MNRFSRSAILLLGLLAACGAVARADEPAPPVAKPAAATKPAPNTASEVKLETLPAVTLLALQMTGSFDQHAAAIGKVVQYGMTAGVMRGAPLGIYYNDPEKVPVDSLRWDVCVPVPPGSKAEAPFAVLEQSEMQAAVVTCTGPYQGTAPCYGVLTAWLEKNSYAIAGPVQEHWLSDPSTPPEKMQSKIVFPVKKLPTRQP
jgi:AraC family transcriptional regulator